MQDFEKLGAFYLGKRYDLDDQRTTGDWLLYDAKDLTTHAVCVGMTGSGKTGLCISLLEEAAIDGIPALVIDPKGDLGNLMLTFPDLAADDFRPWIDESQAVRQGMTADQYASQTAQRWRDGLEQWGQDGQRIERLREAAEVAIYTPGSNAGLPLTVLRSFDAPPAQVVEDSDAFRQRVSASTSGLLALLGRNIDPVQSREHILIANLLDRAWREGRNLDLAGLIREIQSPPFDRVGVMALDSFFPSKDRAELAMTLNNLLASPTFASWLEGEPLNIRQLLYTPEGKPRLAILSIAHLSESERMFFVTILLNEVVTWMRAQPGTSSLRALLYMDEVFGYFPPSANPPSKQPMLTLLKQARAYGLGVVLATQNPVDLDYKGLSNAGTWFLGRLQTERDKQRVLEGLEGASAQAGSDFDRAKMEATLASLGSRVFLMNNVHEDEPVIFKTRFALSYLRGPLTRVQVQTLMADRRQALAVDAAARTAPRESLVEKPAPRPSIPDQVPEVFLPVRRPAAPEGRLVYRPALLGRARLHFIRATYKIDHWQSHARLLLAPRQIPSLLWEESIAWEGALDDWRKEPEPSAEFAELPSPLLAAKNYKSWATKLKAYLYRSQAATVWKCAELKQYSQLGEAEGDFRIRLSQLAHERRDLELEKLRTRYAKRLATIKGQVLRAQQRLEREKSQYSQRRWESLLSFGTTILGAVFGRKLASRANVGKASTSMRSVGRAARERDDVGQAKETLAAAEEKLAQLDAKFQQDIQAAEDRLAVDRLSLEALKLAPRKSDILIEQVALVWTPWHVDSAGIAEPLY